MTTAADVSADGGTRERDGETPVLDGAAAEEMYRSEFLSAADSDFKPIFLDLRGRRRMCMRVLGYLLFLALAAVLAAIVAGLSSQAATTPTYVIGG